MKTKSLLLLPSLIAALNLIPAGRVAAQTFTTLHNFTGGGIPFAGLVLSSNTLYGTTYGTAYYGGSSGNGTIFKLSTNGTGFTVLQSGGNPQAGLILSGNTLYGTTVYGGSSGNGSVFALNTNGAGFTILHSFTATSQPG